MNYREALAWLYSTQQFGIKLGLENIRRLLEVLDAPAPAQRIIHVAGTNGKGSVCAMAEAICRAAGYRTGLFTSPHLISFRERIQIRGEHVAEPAVAAGLTRIKELTASWNPAPTFFEITTALALREFVDQGVEVIALETGMGGRLDATNAVQPVVSVITPIGLDHQAWLGNSVAEIATEKAGIIKAGVPVVSAKQVPDAEEVLRKRAAELRSPLEFVTRSSSHPTALFGLHQSRNAALAIAALRAANLNICEKAVVSGLATVQWPARFQLFDERTVIDGAHNAAGAQILAETWRAKFGEANAAVVFGVLRDKEAIEIFRPLAAIAHPLILPHFHGQRAMPPAELATLLDGIAQQPISIAASCAEAIHDARLSDRPVLITGSLHLAGEALASLERRPAAFEECDQ